MTKICPNCRRIYRGEYVGHCQSCGMGLEDKKTCEANERINQQDDIAEDKKVFEK